MQAIQMEVNKKQGTAGNMKYNKVGEVTIYVPTLHEVFPEAKVQKDDKGNDVLEDGLPVYEDDKHNYIQGAIFAAVKAQARNKLVSGTVTLKDGLEIAKDWAALTAESERGGNGAALAIIHEAKRAFADYVAKLQKSAAATQMLNMLFSNKQALALQTDDNKKKFENYVTEFATSLSEEQMAKFEKYITSVLASCEASTAADDF